MFVELNVVEAQATRRSFSWVGNPEINYLFDNLIYFFIQEQDMENYELQLNEFNLSLLRRF